jgi:rhomboid protease GluP
VVTFDQALRAATPVVWVTPAIVAINVAVFVAMVVTGVSPISPTAEDLFKWGADYGPAVVLDGQWWRLATSAFVHIGALHIALNMYVFWGAGVLVERLYGNAAFLILYLFAALGGSLVSTLWSPLSVSAGASGAVFGVCGAILAYVRIAGREFPVEVVAGLRKGAVGFVVYNVLFGLMVPNISNSAHLGGLASGFVAGLLLARDLQAPRDAETQRTLRGLALLPILAALAWGAHHRISRLPALRSYGPAQDAAAAMEARDWARARNRLDEAIALDPGNGQHYLSRGYARGMVHDNTGAVSDYGEAIARDPKAASPLAMRCLALYGTDEYDRAAKDCDAALALDPSNAEASLGRAQILAAKGLDDEAIRAARQTTVLSPSWAPARLLLARLLIDKGDFVAADLEVAKASEAAPEDPWVATTRAHLLLRRGDFASARKESDRAVLLAPKEPWAYTVRADVFRAQGDFERALADEERAVELDPNNAAWHNGRAWTLLQLGRLADGMEAIERSLALNPASPQALGTHCWIRVSLGDRSGGKADCERAVALLPGDEIDRGMVDFLEGRYGQAAAEWQRGTTTHPADAAFLRTWIAKAESAGRAAARAR